jgi:hypothetical protein
MSKFSSHFTAPDHACMNVSSWVPRADIQGNEWYCMPTAGRSSLFTKKSLLAFPKKYEVATPKAVTFPDATAREERYHGGEGVIRKGGCRRVGGWPTRQDAG